MSMKISMDVRQDTDQDKMNLDILATLFDRRNRRVTHSEVYMTRGEIQRLLELQVDLILTRARRNYERTLENESRENYDN